MSQRAASIPEFRRIFEVGGQYLDGKASIQELNGVVAHCRQVALLESAAPAVRLVLDEWQDMIDRRWNEWSHAQNPVSEDEFARWIRTQLLSGASSAG
jgi:hypothetical protein